MRVASWITSGAMAALLLATPAGGSPDLGITYVYADDLYLTSPVSISPRAQDLQRLAVSLLVEAPGGEEFDFRVIAVSAGGVQMVADFAVMVTARGGKSRITGVQLPFASRLYLDLFYARAGFPEAEAAELQANIHRQLQETSPRQFLDARNERGDSTEVREIKQRIQQFQALRRMERCEATIPDRLAYDLESAFRAIIVRSRDPRTSPTHDEYGETGNHVSRPHRYYFQMGGYWPREGYAPPHQYRGSRPELMSAAGILMRDYCQTKNPAYLETLRQVADRLNERRQDGTILPSRPGQTPK